MVIKYNLEMLNSLKKLRVLTKFIKNCENYLHPTRDVHTLISSFTWRDSPEGVPYWLDIDYKMHCGGNNSKFITIKEFRRLGRLKREGVSK